jgi:hypothetical protein
MGKLIIMQVTIEAAMREQNESFIAQYDGHLTESKETPDGVIYYTTDL